MLDVGCERLLTSFVDNWNSRFPHPASHLDGTIPTLRLLYFASMTLGDNLGRDLYFGYIIGDCWTSLDEGGVTLKISDEGSVILRSENLNAELDVSAAFDAFLHSPLTIPDWLPEDDAALIFEQYTLGLLLGTDPQIIGGNSGKPFYALTDRLMKLCNICRAALNANLERYSDLQISDRLNLPGSFLLLPLTDAGDSPFLPAAELLQESISALSHEEQVHFLLVLCCSPSRLLELAARGVLLSIEEEPSTSSAPYSSSEIEIFREIAHTLRKARGEPYDWRIALHEGDLPLAKRLLARDRKQGLFPLFFGSEELLDRKEIRGLLSAAAVGQHFTALDDAPPAHLRESDPALELQYLFLLLHCEEVGDLFPRLSALKDSLPEEHPLRGSLYELMGLALREQDRNLDALHCFELALAHAPIGSQTHERLRYHCAWAALIAGDDARCKGHLVNAPHSRLFLEIEFLLAERSGNSAEEQRILVDLLSIAPNDSELIELALQKG